MDKNKLITFNFLTGENIYSMRCQKLKDYITRKLMFLFIKGQALVEDL